MALEVVVILYCALHGPWETPSPSLIYFGWCPSLSMVLPQCVGAPELLLHIGLKKESTSRVGQVLCLLARLRFAKCPCTNLRGAVFA